MFCVRFLFSGVRLVQARTKSFINLWRYFVNSWVTRGMIMSLVVLRNTSSVKSNIMLDCRWDIMSRLLESLLVVHGDWGLICLFLFLVKPVHMWPGWSANLSETGWDLHAHANSCKHLYMFIRETNHRLGQRSCFALRGISVNYIKISMWALHPTWPRWIFSLFRYVRYYCWKI